MIAAAAATVATPMAALTGTASAATSKPLPSSLAQFAHCPVSNPDVSVCIYATETGTFLAGSATVNTTATLQIGAIPGSSGSLTGVLPTDGTPGLQTASANVAVLGGLLNVGVTEVLSGAPTGSLTNLLSGKGVAISLPLVVNLSNPLLGSSCTLGTAAAPLTVNLTDGTTNPPAPNKPITGAVGKATSVKDVIVITGNTLVDNAFAVPGSSGCGPFGLFNGIVNALEGYPAAAGTNSATLTGTIQEVAASSIRKYIK